MAALIPAIPVMGLIGLYFTSRSSESNIKKYIQSAAVFFSLYVIMFTAMYFLYLKSKNIKQACLYSFILWTLSVLFIFIFDIV